MLQPPEVGRQLVIERALVADANREDMRRAIVATVMTCQSNLALHHLRVDRLRREQNDEILTPLDAPRDLGRPIGADRHIDIDEDFVTGSTQTVDQQPRKARVIGRAAAIRDEETPSTLPYLVHPDTTPPAARPASSLGHPAGGATGIPGCQRAAITNGHRAAVDQVAAWSARPGRGADSPQRQAARRTDRRHPRCPAAAAAPRRGPVGDQLARPGRTDRSAITCATTVRRRSARPPRPTRATAGVAGCAAGSPRCRQGESTAHRAPAAAADAAADGNRPQRPARRRHSARTPPMTNATISSHLPVASTPATA